MRSLLIAILYHSILVIPTKAAAFNIMRLREIANSTLDSRPSARTPLNISSYDNADAPRKQDDSRREWVRWFPLPNHTRSKLRPSRIRRSPTPTDEIDGRPTPDPTGDSSPLTTVHIKDENDFSLILPKEPGELVSDAEADGISYCSPGASSSNCVNRFPDGFITAAAFEASDDGSYIQITGCIQPSQFHLDSSDTGGQFDVRYPNGAQCTFGGYGASFIELVEPATNRFCIRCCSSANDQANCNSHQDRMGCINAIPGIYDFPDVGISCS